MSEDKLNTKKWLYSFKVPRKYTKTVKEESKDDEGKPITISREKDVTEDVEIFLKRPTRKMFDECNLFYSVKVSEGVKSGLLTRSMINKRYQDDAGALSEDEKKHFNDKYGELLNKEKEFQVLQLNLQDDKKITDEQRQEKLGSIVVEIEELKAELERYQVKAEDLYEHTAEARAARQTNMWWLLFLTHIKFKNEERGGIDDWMPMFAGKNFDKRLEDYELVEQRIADEEDKYIHFEAEVIERASYLLAAWNGGNCKTFEDFERVQESLNYIKEEVRKDESLQEVYDEKIKVLAGLEVPVESE
mgnify:CR=1 FL=1|tara:strand:- start:379 stop:1287 length:909 start_codon:yes stop_codon:yes gene_type:complete